ncbi:MAG TPA: hypothetical protein VEF04_21240, partial [Blastocatellia bacterium]|nr:hypothetical protein [Blastocatellia bacterium]
MKRLLTILLVGAMAASPAFNFASVSTVAQAQTPNDSVDQARTRLSRPQQQALRELAKQVTELEVNEKSVPRWIMGD